MRIAVKQGFGQLLTLVFLAAFCLMVTSCGAKRDENPVIPPVTGPLTRDYIGYGVITESFTHITNDPSDDSESLGYLRRGSLVKVIRRQTVKTGNVFVSWVLIDGEQNGWLKEEVMNIYESDSQAVTASESILK
jgi:hypothetical protein